MTEKDDTEKVYAVARPVPEDTLLAERSFDSVADIPKATAVVTSHEFLMQQVNVDIADSSED